jgi:hypothetical protein
MGTRNVIVAVYRNSSPYEEVEADVERTDANTVTIRTSPYVPAASEFIVAIASGGSQAVLNLTMDGWHYVGNPGEPAFAGTWTSWGTGEALVAFRKLPDGKVQLKGLAKGGTTAPIFTLPAGYRPPVGNPNFACLGHNGSAYGVGSVYINAATGEVRPITSPFNIMLGGNAYTYLDSIQFDTETVSQAASVSVQPMDVWHYVGGAGEPAFGPSVANGSATDMLASFRKYPDGRVRLRGYVTCPTASATLFTLPVGYRPPRNYYRFAVVDVSGAACYVYVDGSGNVIKQSSNTSACIDGIEFDTELVSGYSQGAIVPYTNPLVTMDSWHAVGATGEPAFQNSWVNFDGAAPTGRYARFRRYPDGRVRMAGVVKTGASGTVAFTLPAGYRPPSSEAFSVLSGGNAAGQVVIGSDGTVLLQNGASPSNVSTFVFLDGVEFDTESVLQTTSITAQPLDKWHNVGDPGEPSFNSPWVNYGGGEQPAGFRKYPDGRVRLRGIVKSGTSATTLWTLPAGYRPPLTLRFAVVANDAYGTVVVTAGGAVNISAGNTTYFDLSGVEFDTELVGGGGYATATFPYLPVTMDTWHTVGAVGEPAFTNSWVSYDAGATFQVPQFRKLGDGRVEMRGTAKSGTLGSSMWTLPVGYRPLKAQRFTGTMAGGVQDQTSWQQINVYPDGTIVAWGSSNGIISLDGIFFDTETVTQTASVSAQPLDTVHYVGATGEPAFGAGWQNYSPGNNPMAKFRKYPDGRVRLSGVVKGAVSGGANPIFTLPAGYRPPLPAEIDFAVNANGAYGSVGVTAQGLVYLAQGSGSSYLYLDGIEFDTETQSSYPSAFVQINAPTKVTSLPTSPVDGQEVYYVADATNGVLWHLRYNAGSASAYKWEFVGGSDLNATVETSQASAAGTGYQDFSTVGPSITLPLAGDYDFIYGAAMGDSVQNRCLVSPSIAGAGPSDADALQSAGGPTTGNNDASTSRVKRFTGRAAGNVIKLMYRNAISSTTASYEKRWLSIRPVRVG